MAGLCAVGMMFGKNSCFPRSTFISQQSDSLRIDVAFVFYTVAAKLHLHAEQNYTFVLLILTYL